MSRIAKFYGSWKAMHTRCYDKNFHSYHRYGGRGIRVCLRWHEYENFRSDMLATWQAGLTLDRVDNDGDYEPENCEWLPKSENTKSLLVDPVELLHEYRTSGLNQYQLAEKYGTDQPHISRILARGRKREQKA